MRLRIALGLLILSLLLPGPAGADTWFETTSGWVRAYVYVNSASGALHTHGGTGLSGRKA